MLWALLSSAFVIYLYRKLNTPEQPDTTGGGSALTAVEKELANLNDKIEALERRLSKDTAPETRP